MVRMRLHGIASVLAGLALAGSAVAADEVKKPAFAPPAARDVSAPAAAPRGFYGKFLAPRMTSRLSGEIAAADEFANPAANPWTKDNQTVTRIETNAIRAAKSALKRYAIESLRIDAWSLPLVKAGGNGFGTVGNADSRARLRFGISHLAPRAEVVIPSARGRAAFSADTRGGLAASFESNSFNFSLGLSYDVSAHAGTFAISRRF